MPTERVDFLEEIEMVSIPKHEYANLIARRERIEAVRRFIEGRNYISTEDVMSILDIRKQKG